MATTKELVARAVSDVGDDPSTLVCYYLPVNDGEKSWMEVVRERTLVLCSFDELPTRSFNGGFGGVEGEPVICFSDRYVYVKVIYDGSEWVEAVPRNPEGVTAENLPELGE